MLSFTWVLCQVGLGLSTRPVILPLADVMVLTNLVSPPWVDLAHCPQAYPHGLIEWLLMHWLYIFVDSPLMEVKGWHSVQTTSQATVCCTSWQFA